MITRRALSVKSLLIVGHGASLHDYLTIQQCQPCINSLRGPTHWLNSLCLQLEARNINLVEIAQRIRNQRLDRHLTLDDIATKSWLCKAENFRIGLTLVVVANGERKVDERNKSKTNTTMYQPPSHKHLNRSMAPFLLMVPASFARSEPLTHGGEEFLFVQKGAIDFEFYWVVTSLRKNVSLEFDSHIPKRIINPHKSEAVVLYVFSESERQLTARSASHQQSLNFQPVKQVTR